MGAEARKQNIVLFNLGSSVSIDFGVINKFPFCTLFKCMAFLIFVTFVGDFAGEGNGNPLRYSCPGNLIDGEAWWATGSQTRLSN